MVDLPQKLARKLDQRREKNAFRHLPDVNHDLIDFSSNDYLGLARSRALFRAADDFLNKTQSFGNGATGSRLITGNHPLYLALEKKLAEFHQSESALIFNSGYDANLGFFASVPQRGDIIMYDEYIHASIRDGLSLGQGKAIKFRHNSLDDLKNKLNRERAKILENAVVYIVTESVFSMDGDSPELKLLVDFCEVNNCLLVVDEAHAVGVFGDKGEGLVQQLNLQKRIFARIVTFGKGVGCHGAVVLTSESLKSYLINFARSFIYTTGLSPHSLATIFMAYDELDKKSKAISQLRKNIEFFKIEVERLNLSSRFINSNSAIHCLLVANIDKAKDFSLKLQEGACDVRAILSPTVPEGQERLRICLHSYNTDEEILNMLRLLSVLVS